MKKGLIYISPPSLTSPSLQNAIDDAPRLDGADLNTPLFSGIATNSPNLDTRSASTFATSPSLFSAVLKYILHYQFDVPEFLELLDTLDEVRIPRITKEENVDTFSEFRTFRAHDVTDESLGNPEANNDIVAFIPFDEATGEGERFSYSLSAGDMVEFAVTQSKKPLLVKGDIKSELDKVFTLSESPTFKRTLDIFFTQDPNRDDLAAFIPFNPDTLEGEHFRVSSSNVLEEYFDVLSNQPLLFVGNVETPFDKIFTEIEERRHTKPDVEDGIGILPPPAEGAPKDGEVVDARILPNFTEILKSFSNVSTIAKTLPTVPFEKLFSDSSNRATLFAKDVFKEVTDENGNPANIEYTAKILPFDPDTLEGERTDYLFKTTKDTDLAKLKSVPPYIIKGDLASFIDFFSSISEEPDVKPLKGIEKNTLVDAYRTWPSYAGTEPANRDFKAVLKAKKSEFDVVETKQIINFLGKEQKLPIQKAVTINKKDRKKIILDFVIEETYYSIHDQYPGGIVAATSPIQRYVDLGSAWDVPIPGPNEPSEAYPDGWPIGTQFWEKNERYISIPNIYENIGKFREGRTHALKPILRERYSLATLNSLGQNPGDLNRFADSAMVSTNSAKIWSEGAELIGFYMPNGFGYNGYYGPAPIKYVYGLVPSEAAAGIIDRVPKWHTEQGLYYNKDIYSETVTHSGGRRINLLMREMTPNDIALSNKYGGRYQYTKGITFIDKMLAHAYWGKIFKFVDTIVKVDPGLRYSETVEAKERLATKGQSLIAHEKVIADFLHRYESEALAAGAGEEEEIPYDVILNYFPGPDRDTAIVDGFKEWPSPDQFGTLGLNYIPEPPNRDAKVKLKFFIEKDLDKASANSLTPLLFVGSQSFKLDKVQSEAERHPHHIVKKPLYYISDNGTHITSAQLRTAIESPTAPLDSNGDIVNGRIWKDTTTEKFYLGTVQIIGYVEETGDPITNSFWDHIGPFEEKFTSEEEVIINQFKVFDREVAKSKSHSPYIFSGDTLFKLDKIMGIVEEPDIVQNKGLFSSAETIENGYFRSLTITFYPVFGVEDWSPDEEAFTRSRAALPTGKFGDAVVNSYFDAESLQYVYTYTGIYIPKPETNLSKDIFLNEVAAADSGTAFVHVYCRPSYFLETYVGEDGKFANF